MPDAPDLDATIAALDAAVAAADRSAIATHLDAIERSLESMNPLMRGLTYAHVKSALGEPAQAVAVIEDLLELMPDRGVVYYQLGCYRRAAGDEDGALGAFTRATELDASLADAWVNRGVLLDARGQWQGAIEAYRHAILRSPAEADVWRNLGNSLAALGHFDEALEAYRTAAGLRPDDPTVAFLTASAHQAKGEVERANARLPEATRAALGLVYEVRLEAGDTRLGCRFHATTEQAPSHRAAARSLLEDIAPTLADYGDDAFPIARERSFLVRYGGQVLLCDTDPTRPGLPNRFFDATEVVKRASAERR